MKYTYLRDCLEIDEECPSWLRWKLRPQEHFETYRSWRANCGRFAGQPAGMLKLFRDRYYWTITVNGKKLLCHRVIWMLDNQRDIPCGVLVDHRDNNSQNNSPDNLRAATHTQNIANSVNREGKFMDLPKGVNYHSTNDSFTSAITLGGVRHHLGTFYSVHDAKLAYDKAAQNFHGSFFKSN